MDERYSEDEVQRILDLASRGEPCRHDALPEGGMSLAEIQDIGREVGIAPADILWAATELSTVPERGRRARLLTLAETPSDGEWDRMVVALREVFGVPGSVERSGTLRTWRGAGVSVHGEPAESGYRLRIEAENHQARQISVGGVVAVVISLVLAAVTVATGTAETGTNIVWGALAAFGVGWSGYGRFALSKWEARTDRQLTETVRRLSGHG
ncbi:MAG: hypothetical protein OEO79_05415 [Gemmatimonadota bacterium]|nr:hypothetical protein [Gemmatimonadota bacterium]MDH3424321.1 hypothetical protein [Gemmatimonadota bacterium]